MERRLYEAALEGDEVSLLELLQEDALALDRELAPVDTPLHIAAMLGHVRFAKEILSRKGELAGELNLQGRSPLHLASAKGHVEIVKLLLSINPSVCLARDRDGRTPLHLAAMKDRVEVLNELVKAKPEACWIRDDRGETILHLCITHNSFEALKLLVSSVRDHKFVDLKDDNGNSLLHLVVINKKLEMLNFLLECTKINVNMLNAFGFSALDVLSQSPRDLKDKDILESLQQAGAVKAKDGGLRKNKRNDEISTKTPYSKGSSGKDDPKKKHDWVRKHSNLMVVASLIATMAFQAGVNPPGGVWQEDSSSHSAGVSIMATENADSYDMFFISNTVGFLASLSIILLLISGLPLKHKFFVWVLSGIIWVAITSMALTYLYSIDAITPPRDTTHYTTLSFAIWSWMGLMGLLLLGHTIRLAVRLLKTFSKFIRRLIQGSKSRMNRNCNNV